MITIDIANPNQGVRNVDGYLTAGEQPGWAGRVPNESSLGAPVRLLPLI